MRLLLVLLFITSCAKVPVVNTKTKDHNKALWCFSGKAAVKKKLVNSVFCTELKKVCLDVNKGAIFLGRHYGVKSVTECKQSKVNVSY